MLAAVQPGVASSGGQGRRRGDPPRGDAPRSRRAPHDQACALPGPLPVHLGNRPVGTNDAAVAHCLDQRDAPARALVAAALGWRTVPPIDEQSAARLLRGQMVPLYAYYIDDHIARLRALGERELARAFADWRERLAG